MCAAGTIITIPFIVASLVLIFISNAITSFVDFIYHIFKCRMLGIWRKISSNRNNLILDQLPTTHIPLSNFAQKHSPISKLAPVLLADTAINGIEPAFHIDFMTTIRGISTNPILGFPPTCAKIEGGSGKRYSQPSFRYSSLCCVSC